jgi:hypothetical protein
VLDSLAVRRVTKTKRQTQAEAKTKRGHSKHREAYAVPKDLRERARRSTLAKRLIEIVSDSAWSLLRVVRRSMKQEPLGVTPRIPVVHGGEKSTDPPSPYEPKARLTCQ